MGGAVIVNVLDALHVPDLYQGTVEVTVPVALIGCAPISAQVGVPASVVPVRVKLAGIPVTVPIVPVTPVGGLMVAVNVYGMQAGAVPRFTVPP